MNCYVVVEGELDGKLLERILYGDVPGAPKKPGIMKQWSRDSVRIVVARGPSAATSKARSLLATRRGPVVLLVDADAYKPIALAARREEIEEALGQFGRPEDFRVILFVPEMESILLRAPSSKAIILGSSTFSAEDAVRARYEPREVVSTLAQLSKRTRNELVKNAIENLDPQETAQFPEILELQEFLDRWMSKAA